MGNDRVKTREAETMESALPRDLICLCLWDKKTCRERRNERIEEREE